MEEKLLQNIMIIYNVNYSDNYNNNNNNKMFNFFFLNMYMSIQNKRKEIFLDL
jgi:hypothetical protein